jgi:hypothetical protein
MMINRRIFAPLRVFIALLVAIVFFVSTPVVQAKLAGTPVRIVPEPTHIPLSDRSQRFVQKNPLLDSAFVMLERGNPFIVRYNKLTGSFLEARYKYGLPYFFGGRLENRLLKRIPAWQDSDHFKAGRLYVYGFDCLGYTQWVYRSNGMEHPDAISDMFSLARSEENMFPLMDKPFDRWRDILRIGDILALHGEKWNHVMIYIGTLGEYNWNESNTDQALHPYLDYPLFIHTSINHKYVERYAKYIEENDFRNVYNTDGGVAVSLVGAPLDAAPGEAWVDGRIRLKYFDLDGYDLTIYDISTKKAYIGWRIP